MADDKKKVEEKRMIDSNYFLLIVFLMCLGTFLIRYSFIGLSDRMKIPNEVKDLFTYIPAAILPGLFIPATFYYQGQVTALLQKERFIIILLCFLLTIFIRNTLLCITVGLGLLYLVRWG